MYKKMYKKTLYFIVFAAFTIICGIINVSATSEISIWDGTATSITPNGNVYKVDSASQLAWIASEVNRGANNGFQGKTINLNIDIDLDNQEWTAIGTSSNSFKGTFDGQGHVITGLNINKPQVNYQGLFGYIENAFLKKIAVINCSILGKDYIGCLVGNNTSGEITECYAYGNISSSGNDVGGLVGIQQSGTILNSYVSGNVYGDGRVGGLLGRNYNGTVSSCYSTVNVSGASSSIGGLIGNNIGSVANSYWDIDASGISVSTVGTGMHTSQLIDRLPTGFDKSYWDIMGLTTYPYLKNLKFSQAFSITINTPVTVAANGIIDIHLDSYPNDNLYEGELSVQSSNLAIADAFILDGKIYVVGKKTGSSTIKVTKGAATGFGSIRINEAPYSDNVRLEEFNYTHTNNGIEIRPLLNNNTGSFKNFPAAVALYDKNRKMIRFIKSDTRASQMADLNVLTINNINDNDYSYAKFFLWNDMSSMSPYTSGVIFK